MPTYIIKQTSREIWEYYFSVEADSKEAAENLFTEGNITSDNEIDREYIDTVTTEWTIEEE